MQIGFKTKVQKGKARGLSVVSKEKLDELRPDVRCCISMVLRKWPRSERFDQAL